MKSFTPLFLTLIALPFVLTGCNRSSDTGMATDTTSTNAPAADTNAAPAAATTPAATTNAPAAASTNSMPAK